MIEPGIADLVASAVVDWSRFGLCPVCKAHRGEACVALNGRVAGSRPDGVAVELARTHAARKPWRRT